MKERKVKLTKHRGNRRLWLEGKWLNDAGFLKGTPYGASFSIDTNSIVLTALTTGDRIVSGRDRKKNGDWTPIIDISCPEVARALGDIDHALISYYPDQNMIFVRPAHEARKDRAA